MHWIKSIILQRKILQILSIKFVKFALISLWNEKERHLSCMQKTKFFSEYPFLVYFLLCVFGAMKYWSHFFHKWVIGKTFLLFDFSFFNDLHATQSPNWVLAPPLWQCYILILKSGGKNRKHPKIGHWPHNVCLI